MIANYTQNTSTVSRRPKPMPPMTTVTFSGTGVVVVGRVVPVVVLAVVVAVVVGPAEVVVDGQVGPVMVVSGDVVVDQGDVVESPLQTDRGGVK